MADKNGIYGITNYLWELLQQKCDWDLIGNLVPITASGDQPEFFDQPKAYIVYGWSSSPKPSDVYVRNAEIASLTVYGGTVSQVNDVINTIRGAFERFDDSASDVNNWLQTDSGNRYDHIMFNTIEVIMIEGPSSPTAEGGKYDGNIVIRYEYTRQDPPNTYRLT